MKVLIPEEYRKFLKIGTCSWKFESWKGLYYETGKSYRAGDFLPDYAKYLNSVEIDQWFWSLFPGGNRLPELGPLMFQFEYLNKQKMSSKEDFFEKFGTFISKAPSGYSYAVEIRNPNYLSQEFFNFLKEYKLGYVYLDGYYMPPIGEVFKKYFPATADFAVVRLHGGDRKKIEETTGEIWNTIAAPKPKGLESAAIIVKNNQERGMRTFVNVNNHYEGSAPLTIDRFLDVLVHIK